MALKLVLHFHFFVFICISGESGHPGWWGRAQVNLSGTMVMQENKALPIYGDTYLNKIVFYCYMKCYFTSDVRALFLYAKYPNFRVLPPW